MTDAKPGEVYERFAKAFAAVAPIRKAQKNAHHGYTYRGIDDVLNALHDVLAEHGLFYVPRCVGEAYEEWKTSKGGRLQVARLKYEFVFYAPDGSSFPVGPVVGQAADTDDKAPMQALSQAAKPALLHAFCIQTEDTHDADAASPVSQAGGRVDPLASPEQLDDLQAVLKQTGEVLGAAAEKKARTWIHENYGVPTYDALTAENADHAIDRLTKRVAVAQAEQAAASSGEPKQEALT